MSAVRKCDGISAQSSVRFPFNSYHISEVLILSYRTHLVHDPDELFSRLNELQTSDQAQYLVALILLAASSGQKKPLVLLPGPLAESAMEAMTEVGSAFGCIGHNMLMLGTTRYI